MAVDYNLVILGGSLIAHQAAIRAAQSGGRVALVEPPRHRLFSSRASPFRWELEQMQLAYLLTNYNASAIASRQDQLAQARAFAAWQLEQHAPAQLATYGIDVVIGQGKFIHQPSLGVQVDQRILRGHSYLVAVNAEPYKPVEVAGRRISALQQLQQTTLQSIIVWGAQAHSVVLAQALRRLGLSVILASPAPRLLPRINSAIAEILQGQLEAEGIRIATAATLGSSREAATDLVTLSDPTSPSSAISVQSETLTLTADGVIAAEAYCPQLARLNLPDSVRAMADGIPVNTKLQTAHPSIYACGYAVNPYNTPTVAIAEAQVAVDNALLLPYRRVKYRTIPQLISTDPPVVRVGQTERQARRSHGAITVLQQAMASLPQAQLEHKPVGQCQLILSKRGTILGAEAIGPNAQDWIGSLSWAIERRMTLQSMAKAWPHPAYGEVIMRLANQWRHQRQPNWRRNSLELLLNWRRDWTR